MRLCHQQGKYVRLTPQQWAELERRIQQEPRSIGRLAAESGISRYTCYRRNCRRRLRGSPDVESSVGGRLSDAAGSQRDAASDDGDAGYASSTARAASPQLSPAGLIDAACGPPAESRDWGEVCPPATAKDRRSSLSVIENTAEHCQHDAVRPVLGAER